MLLNARDRNGVMDQDQMEKISELTAIARAMLMRYPARYPHDFDEYEIVAAEQTVSGPLPTPRGFASSWEYEGTIDLLLRDKGKRLWLFEHKTTSETNRDRYELALQLSAQPRGYLYLAQHAFREQPYGVIYNVIRKKLPTVPAGIQCKKCKGEKVVTEKGAAGPTTCVKCAGTGVESLSQKLGVDSTGEVFRHEIAKYPHLKESDYAEILERLDARGDVFLYRFEFDVSAKDLKDWRDDTYRVAAAIMNAKRIGYSHNFEACNAPGRPCQFRQLCLGVDPETARQELFDVLPEGQVSPSVVESDDDQPAF